MCYISLDDLTAVERLQVSVPGPAALPEVAQLYDSSNASVDHVSTVATPKLGPVFWHVAAGITVIVSKTDGAWLM